VNTFVTSSGIWAESPALACADWRTHETHPEISRAALSHRVGTTVYGAKLDALLEGKKLRTRDPFDVFGSYQMQMTIWSFVRITLACSLA
jgi:hypothetical protein